MQINRLRLIGFKSFVEPSDLVIESGLTGVVGPNGCGKSNLLEALRWVMGESSHKSMRAAAMDDVIFSGTTQRPARNSAEVTLFLDNNGRTAPAEYNDSELIEITRRIEREAGSAYRINGRDVRARDVKILFEDAATGARSPALVRQGQIGEIVNAKPEQRRRILEDAAGVAGLHSRRHDAELRLRAADANLARLADILGALTSQIDSLKRQARQARRYKELSAEIRKAEAVAAHVAYVAAHAEVGAEERQLGEAQVRLGTVSEKHSRLTREEAELAERIQPLRDNEAVRSAVLARLKVEQENLEKEAQRAAERQRVLEAHLVQLTADREREAALAADAAESLARLDTEIAELLQAEDGAAAAEATAAAALAAARDDEAAAAKHQDTLQRRDFEIRAKRQSLEASLAERRNMVARTQSQLSALDSQLAAIADMAPDPDRIASAKALGDELVCLLDAAASSVQEAEAALAGANEQAAQSREAAQHARLELRGIESELATLSSMQRARNWDGFTPVLEELTVEPGLEAALGAALGNDLDAPTSDTAPMHWTHVPPEPGDPALPEGIPPLANHVTAPAELARRLAQIGIVTRDQAPGLQPSLKPGQRLVSPEGDLWRWDGFVATADAPTAAAERLAQKNRLIEVGIQLEQAKARAEVVVAQDRAARERLAAAEQALRDARQAERDARARLSASREELVRLERAEREAESRRVAIEETREQASAQLADAQAAVAEIEQRLSGEAEQTGLEGELAAAGQALQHVRARLMQLSSDAAALQRERRLRADRLSSCRHERQRMAERSESATKHIADLTGREAQARQELTTLQALPAEIDAQRQRLLNQLAIADKERQAAADTLAEADNALRQAQQDLREAQADVSTAREARARIEARLEAARALRAQLAHRIRESFECGPDGCLDIAGLAKDTPLPALEEIERQLSRLKSDRERLGGVNLAADSELETINEQFESIEKERADVEEAIAKLRGAIQQLNREGKKRIDDAFQSVNAHFQSLFTTLFNGGEARLEMIEGEDPLEGGLEIIAKPPGKKPATLSLLSGGEQTLTALSLIFAVFLTNPSPICVLDEVDAPLDDANVDRFATMLEKMVSETGTRFLVITHHPMTMARMNRLFGVTMAEKGVSQLVSVDLATAERIIVDQPHQAAG
ncbi:MAG: AAA family ATPase [Hyphomicrobiaceae bacterium]